MIKLQPEENPEPNSTKADFLVEPHSPFVPATPPLPMLIRSFVTVAENIDKSEKREETRVKERGNERGDGMFTELLRMQRLRVSASVGCCIYGAKILCKVESSVFNFVLP